MNVNTMNNKIEAVKAMDVLVGSMNDESAYASWINLMPDQASEDDYRWFAENEEYLQDLVNLFRRLMAKYGKEFYFGQEDSGKSKAY